MMGAGVRRHPRGHAGFTPHVRRMGRCDHRSSPCPHHGGSSGSYVRCHHRQCSGRPSGCSSGGIQHVRSADRCIQLLRYCHVLHRLHSGPHGGKEGGFHDGQGLGVDPLVHPYRWAGRGSPHCGQKSVSWACVFVYVVGGQTLWNRLCLRPFCCRISSAMLYGPPAHHLRQRDRTAPPLLQTADPSSTCWRSLHPSSSPS